MQHHVVSVPHSPSAAKAAMRALCDAMRASSTESTRVADRIMKVMTAMVPAIQELSTDEPVRQTVSGANCAAAMPV
jgi:hypothetical protein